jgi:hypothetical protein
MITIKYPNDVPWLPGYAILGCTEAILMEPNKLYAIAKSPAEKAYATKLKLAADTTTAAIDKMMGVNADDL